MPERVHSSEGLGLTGARAYVCRALDLRLRTRNRPFECALKLRECHWITVLELRCCCWASNANRQQRRYVIAWELADSKNQVIIPFPRDLLC